MFNIEQLHHLWNHTLSTSAGETHVSINTSGCLIAFAGRDTGVYWCMVGQGISHHTDIMTPSNGNIFRVTGTLWGVPATGGFSSQRPVTRSFDVFFDLRLNKRLNKQSRRRWFETPLCSLWRHWNGSCWICLRKHENMFAFSIISQPWHGVGDLNHSV